MDTSFVQLPKHLQREIVDHAARRSQRDGQKMGDTSALTHYSKASMRSIVDSETSMETIMIKFRKDKKRHLNATVDV